MVGMWGMTPQARDNDRNANRTINLTGPRNTRRDGENSPKEAVTLPHPLPPYNPQPRGIECDELSARTMAMSYTWTEHCPQCGHVECQPGRGCGMCKLTKRINYLEGAAHRHG